jgi:ribose transport system substrate-binding protein
VLTLFDKSTVVKYDRRPSFENTLSVVRRHLRQSQARHILVGAVNDQSALGALDAFREAGREQHCAIIGQGGAIEARNELRQRNTRFIGSVAYFPETYGRKIIRIALDILEKRPVPKMSLIQHQIVNALNVNKLYPNDPRPEEISA